MGLSATQDLDGCRAYVTMRHMSELPHVEIPPLTLGRRMELALRKSGVKKEVMAGLIGVHRGTVSRWLADDWTRPPAKAILEKWAEVCRVPEDWLIYGKGTMPTPPAFPHLVAVTKSDMTQVRRRSPRTTRRNSVYNSLVSGKTAA